MTPAERDQIKEMEKLIELALMYVRDARIKIKLLLREHPEQGED